MALISGSEFGVLIFVEIGKPENPEENTWSKDENQQQTQPTCDARSGNQVRATAMVGKRSHHCAIPASPPSSTITLWRSFTRSVPAAPVAPQNHSTGIPSQIHIHNASYKALNRRKLAIPAYRSCCQDQPFTHSHSSRQATYFALWPIGKFLSRPATEHCYQANQSNDCTLSSIGESQFVSGRASNVSMLVLTAWSFDPDS